MAVSADVPPHLMGDERVDVGNQFQWNWWKIRTGAEGSELTRGRGSIQCFYSQESGESTKMLSSVNKVTLIRLHRLQ